MLVSSGNQKLKTPRYFQNTKYHESGFCSLFAILCVCLFSPFCHASMGCRKQGTWKNTMAEHVQPSYFPTSFLGTKNPKAAIPNPYNLNRIPELLVRGGLKVRSTEKYLGHSWFAHLPILPGSAAGAAALKYIYIYTYTIIYIYTGYI